jgi:HTH-type transcriptional regulator/antitoxin HigA
MEIRPIKTEADYATAVCRIEAVWGASPGTLEGDELEVLVTLVETYECQHYPIEA